MTELICCATRHPYPTDDVTGSVGIPLKNVDIKLVDDEGRDISGRDVRGEICVRGPRVIKGYYDNPEANARDWDNDGFFHTGDIGYCEGKSGLWYIVDRKKVSQFLPTGRENLLTGSFLGTHQSPWLPSSTT